jgi:cyclophilin family peptidyl-prolyl cis-trans isomerase
MTWSVLFAFVMSLIPPSAPGVVQRPGAEPRSKPPVEAAPQPAPGNPVVTISTTLGDITAELFKDRAPVSVQNFLQYVADGFYPGTVFHRVMPGFMIQGGGFTKDMVEKRTRPPIQNEATNGLKNVRGSLGMARTQALRSATAQFFINLADNRRLDHAGYAPDDFGYAVFGRVLSGMDVVDRIGALKTQAVGQHGNVPVEPVVITGVTVVSKAPLPAATPAR